MPSLSELLTEVKAAGSTHDLIRRKYLQELREYTGRNVIVYYSAWLQKGRLRTAGVTGFEINDGDMNAFMATVHKLHKPDGLDLILHTPGGGFSATESLVTYLRSVFGMNIRVVVPQLAMSAGTMIAMSAKEILMGKHSSLGPIDPQVGGLPAHAIIEEFDRAKQEIAASPAWIPVWQPIIAKYQPTIIGSCKHAIGLAQNVVKDWLVTGMFDGDPQAGDKANAVITAFTDPMSTRTHDRHISVQRALDAGLAVIKLEDDQVLQERVLTVHHACMITLSQTEAVKLVENDRGIAHIETVDVSLPRSP